MFEFNQAMHNSKDKIGLDEFYQEAFDILYLPVTIPEFTSDSNCTEDKEQQLMGDNDVNILPIQRAFPQFHSLQRPSLKI